MPERKPAMALAPRRGGLNKSAPISYEVRHWSSTGDSPERRRTCPAIGWVSELGADVARRGEADGERSGQEVDGGVRYEGDGATEAEYEDRDRPATGAGRFAPSGLLKRRRPMSDAGGHYSRQVPSRPAENARASSTPRRSSNCRRCRPGSSCTGRRPSRRYPYPVRAVA